ncbi:MAG: sulfotransferase family 2 domain-containing protein [Shimia sp.]
MFDYFVVFAEMRTGSNFLEANINMFPDLSCHGEVFNPHFMAYPDTTELMGFTEAQRNEDPMGLIAAIREGSEGKGGFRFFHDHQEAVLEPILTDLRCGKVILTRNPVDSYVSWKIAQATNQWKLTNATHHKAAQIEFDRSEFEAHLEALQQFQVRLLNTLQKTGQTAFYVAYEDVQDLEVMNGLAKWLGSAHQLEHLNKKLKRQNPAPMSKKVANFDEMLTALGQLDRFDLTRTPNFEPRRGANVPAYTAAAKSPLLYMPIPSGPQAQVRKWLAAMDGVAPRDLLGSFNQKTLRQWRRQNAPARAFTVVRHPVARIYRTFQDKIVGTGKGSYLEIRKTLMRVHNVPLSPDGPGPDWGAAEQKAAFLKFLEFVKANHGGQTAIRVDASWTSQAAILAGYAELAAPDMIVREDRMQADLDYLCETIGLPRTSVPDAVVEDAIPLADIYDEEVEKAVRDIYQRDYITFGFKRWAA